MVKKSQESTFRRALFQVRIQLDSQNSLESTSHQSLSPSSGIELFGLRTLANIVAAPGSNWRMRPIDLRIFPIKINTSQKLQLKVDRHAIALRPHRISQVLKKLDIGIHGVRISFSSPNSNIEALMA